MPVYATVKDWDNSFDIRNFPGVDLSGETDSRDAIQAAIDQASAVRGTKIKFPKGRYLINPAPTPHPFNGRPYGLMIKQGVSIDGEGYATSFLGGANGDMDIFCTSQVGTFPSSWAATDVELSNFLVNGRTDGSGSGFNIWMSKTQNLRMFNIISRFPGSWGIRVEQCRRVLMSQIGATHTDDTNTDGIHFVDCREVVVAGAVIYTDGDDGFIIEATSYDIHDYDITGLVVKAAKGGGLNARGVLLVQDETVFTPLRRMENIKISAAIHECGAAAVHIDGAIYARGIDIQFVARDCTNGLYISNGSSVTDGDIRACSFKGQIIDPDQAGVMMAQQGASLMRGNEIDVQVYNPGDGHVGVKLMGDRWRGRLRVDYDPLADKVDHSNGIDIYGPENQLDVACTGADVNLNLRSTAVRNTLRLGRLTGAVTADINIVALAENNLIEGGSIGSAGGVVGVARFKNVSGYLGTEVTQETSKSTQVTCNGSQGVITTHAAELVDQAIVYFLVANSVLAHSGGLKARVMVNVQSPNSKYRVWVSQIAGGTFRVGLQNVSGGALSEAVLINYEIL